jgi:hypothetical protein
MSGGRKEGKLGKAKRIVKENPFFSFLSAVAIAISIRAITAYYPITTSKISPDKSKPNSLNVENLEMELTDRGAEIYGEFEVALINKGLQSGYIDRCKMVPRKIVKERTEMDIIHIDRNRISFLQSRDIECKFELSVSEGVDAMQKWEVIYIDNREMQVFSGDIKFELPYNSDEGKSRD